MGDPNNIVSMDPVRYSVYISLLTRVFGYLGRYYEGVEREQQTSEADSMVIYTKKFLSTINAFALKNRYSPEYLRRPEVSLTQSGFPYYYDVTQLDADLSTRGERLPKFAPLDDLKRALLEHVMAGPRAEGAERYLDYMTSYLWQISERAYLEQLDLRTHFFQFTPGKLFPLQNGSETNEGRRSYTFSWGCYDPERNRPCVYTMMLEQDISETALHAPNNPEYIKFLEVVRQVAARAPENLKAIGVRLDESFRTLYPKMLKRVCLGPLISPLLYTDVEADPTSLGGRLVPVFRRADLADQEFSLFFSTEYVLSEREEFIPQFLGKQKVRQIFSIPKHDHELLRRGATAAVNYVMLPHRLLQNFTADDFALIPEVASADRLAYQPEGDVIDVG